jgi:site-specific recombinase XerD
MDIEKLRHDNHIVISRHTSEYLSHLAAKKYSQRSMESYKHGLSRFASFLAARDIRRIADVTGDHLAAFRLELVEGDYAIHSINLYLRSVKNLFAYLEATGQVFINPAASLIIPRQRNAICPVPTEHDMKALLSVPDISTPTGIRDRAIIETFYSAGIRLAELVNMNARDVDGKQGRARVTGKGKKQRVVPLGRQALFWTDRYLKDVRPRFIRKRIDEHALWLGFCGKRIHPLIVERFVKAYGEQAGLSSPITPHALRRACATHMLRGGAHPVEIQLLLGHASLACLSQYLNVTIADMKKTHAKGRPGK